MALMFIGNSSIALKLGTLRRDEIESYEPELMILMYVSKTSPMKYRCRLSTPSKTPVFARNKVTKVAPCRSTRFLFKFHLPRFPGAQSKHFDEQLFSAFQSHLSTASPQRQTFIYQPLPYPI